MLTAVLLAAALMTPPPSSGAQLYTADCATCHGALMRGTADGPSLRGVGPASVDFYLRTGRMPAAVPDVQVAHRDARAGQRLPDDQIAAIEAYLAPAVAGGPPIPMVAGGGDVEHGLHLYEANCQQCHGVGGYGGSLGQTDWAPALDLATAREIGDAVRTGPGEMPRFGVHQLTAPDVDDLAAYVRSMRTAERQTGQIPLRSTGPVPEGAVSYLAIVVLIVFVFFYWRNDTAPAAREEAVRRDET